MEQGSKSGDACQGSQPNKLILSLFQLLELVSELFHADDGIDLFLDTVPLDEAIVSDLDVDKVNEKYSIQF